MKMSRIGFALICLSITISSAVAQTLEKTVTTLPKVAVQLKRQASKPLLDGTSTVARVVGSQVSHEARYVSPFLPFLKEEWEEPVTPVVRIPRSYADRSLESLRQECQARGILPLHWENYSRAELANFLFHYNAHVTGAQGSSLLGKETGASREVDVKRWAQAQPDFIASNYLDEEEYTEPFTGPVTPLRILVVNDEWEYIESLRVAAWQDGNIRLDYADSVHAAMEKLKNSLEGYDIVLLDHDMDGGNGTILSIWMHEQKIQTPAVLYAMDYIAPEWLYKYNVKGRIDIYVDPQAVLNFARNIVTTGRAYPNGK